MDKKFLYQTGNNKKAPYSFVNYVLYYKIPYYSGTLIYDSVYGHFVDVKFGNDICYCVMALGSTQPLTEMNTRNISWGVNVAGV